METSQKLRTAFPRATILIVDDSLEWRVKVRKMLVARPEWRIIAEACNGCEAVRIASELRPDLVLLDIGMPGMNGIEAAERIREAMPVSKIVSLTQDNDTDLSDGIIFVSRSQLGTDAL